MYFCATVEASKLQRQIQYTTCSLGLAYQKTTLRTKIGGGLGQRNIQKKFGTPCVSLQSLKLAISNLVHKFGLGLAYQKDVQDQNLRASSRGVHPKKLGPLLISATVETSNFKFGIQLGFEISYQKTTFRTKIGGGRVLGQGSIRKNWDPYLFLQPLKLATEKLVHNMSSGLPCQTQVLFRQGLS